MLATAKTLSDAEVLAPSGLPGWSRGHVLTHIARNADSLVNLLTSAATGVEHPQYPSREARDLGIDAGSGPPSGGAAGRHRGVAPAVHGRRRRGAGRDCWQHEVRWMSGEPRPASKILDARLREVAIHHIDLDAGYSASDWSSQFALRILVSVLPAFEVRGIEPVTLVPTDVDVRIDLAGGSAVEVRGAASALATWVLGRDDGSTLEVTGGQLPTPPAWT